MVLCSLFFAHFVRRDSSRPPQSGLARSPAIRITGSAADELPSDRRLHCALFFSPRSRLTEMFGRMRVERAKLTSGRNLPGEGDEVRFLDVFFRSYQKVIPLRRDLESHVPRSAGFASLLIVQTRSWRRASTAKHRLP